MGELDPSEKEVSMMEDNASIVDSVEEAVVEAESAEEAVDAGHMAPVMAIPGLARLVLKRAGSETDTVFPVMAPAVVGRFDPTVGPIDVDLGALQPEGTYISRRHARILFEDGVFRVEDLGSSNGTFLLRDDFVKVENEELVDGQDIAFGNARFVFRIGEA